MPELPEVETVRRALADTTTGRVIHRAVVSNHRMRWPWPPNLPAMLESAEITGWRRRGKYLLADCAHPQKGAMVLLLHLGMSGSVRIYDTKPPRARHDHLGLAMGDAGSPPSHYIVLNDPRRFGGGDLFSAGEEAGHRLLRGMGIEPLGNRLSGGFLADALRGKTAEIKTVLLDQRIIAGIGNIYASEALFEAGISPRRKAGRISRKRLDALAAAIRDVLGRAIAAGGTTLRDHIRPGGDIGYFARALAVYGREGERCNRCGEGRIRSLRQAGRAGYYCPQCQR